MPQDLTPSGEEHTFSAIASLIQERRSCALQAVNTQLIELYCKTIRHTQGQTFTESLNMADAKLKASEMR